MEFSVSAADGCLQYYTGVSGMMMSFNYNNAAGLQLSKTDYTICVRTERNFCGIQYTACTDTGIVRSQVSEISFKRAHHSAVAIIHTPPRSHFRYLGLCALYFMSYDDYCCQCGNFRVGKLEQFVRYSIGDLKHVSHLTHIIFA